MAVSGSPWVEILRGVRQATQVATIRQSDGRRGHVGCVTLWVALAGTLQLLERVVRREPLPLGPPLTETEINKNNKTDTQRQTERGREIER